MIEIGYTGEEKFRKVQIDMSAWMDDMPNGVPSIVHIRPGESEAYIVTTTFVDNILTWEVAMNDMGSEQGMGMMQVWLEETENTTLIKRGKSATVATLIRNAINDPGDTEPPARTMLLNLQAEAATLPAGSSATAEWEHDGYYGDYTLKLGIPKGDKGDPTDISGKADKVESATSGDFAGLDASGNLTDSGHKPSEFATGGEVAIMCEGDTHIAISSGEYVVVRNHETLDDGLYKATANIAQNGALSTSNLTAQDNGLGGAVNALNSSVSTLNSRVGKIVDAGRGTTNTSTGIFTFTVQNSVSVFLTINTQVATFYITSSGSMYSAEVSGYTITKSGDTVTITKTTSVGTAATIAYIMISA